MLSSADRALIEKYNRPGPRYTSYPTALQFADWENPIELLDSSKGTNAPLSLYFHLPFCESLCWFCACTTVITKNRNQADPYVQRLLKEVDLTLPHLEPDRPVEQLHFGGGSPSFLTTEQLDTLCTGIRQRFRFTPDAEISAELDPRTLSQDKVEILAKHGFNRVSFGVQDINPTVQKAVHRIQPDSMNRQCLEWIRGAGIHAINTDLIYGLPYQTTESFRQTVETVRQYEPDRFAVFSYAHVPWVAPAQKILERSALPLPEEKFEMLLDTIHFLTSTGYAYIGMDHFAKIDDELTKALDANRLHRNFQGYSTKAGAEMLAFGMSAISQNEDAYRQNTKELKEWSDAIDAGVIPIQKGYLLTTEDKLRKEIIMKVMCSGKLEYAYLNIKYNIDFTTHFSNALENLKPAADDGLIELHPDYLVVTPTGRLLLRNLAMPFDEYFKPSEKRHAKTV